MKRFVIGLCTLVLGIGAFSVARERGTVHLPPPPAHLPTAPADEDDVRWSARNDLDVPERRDVALRVLGFLGHPDDAEVLWRRSLDDDAFGAVATSMLGRVSRADPALRERLVALATSPDARHRASALEALGDLGTPGMDRLAAMGRTDGVLQGLARTRGGTDVAALARLSSGYGEDLALVQNDSRSLDVLEGADRLVAMALHDPERARLELDGRIAERKLDATTRAMIQALPPHAPWLQKVAAAEAPLEERAALLLHFEPDRLAELLGELVFPDPGAALLLHGPSMEAFRHAEAAGDVARMEEIVGAEWSPGQVPDELVTAVLASEPLRGSWLKLPKFLVAAGTPPALEHLFVAASQSAFGSGWVDAIGSIPDPTGAELLWDLVEMEGATGVQEAALKALVARGPEHLERALQTARAEVGRRVDRATLKLLLERGGPEDQEAVLELCVQGTRVECEAVVYEARRWSAIARLADIAGDADDPIRVAILTNALRNGRLDDRIHTWIGDADPVVAGAALERLPEVAGDDLVAKLIAELPGTAREHHWKVFRTLRARDPEAAVAALRTLPDPSGAIGAFSREQDPVSRRLRKELASDPRPEVRASALFGMALGSRDEEDMCRAALADPEPKVREAAARCVSFPETTYAAEQLAAAYRAHGHPEILEALRSVGGPQAEAIR